VPRHGDGFSKAGFVGGEDVCQAVAAVTDTGWSSDLTRSWVNGFVNNNSGVTGRRSIEGLTGVYR
jgi:hypothetical protein